MLNFKTSVFKRVGIFSKSTHGLHCKFSEKSSKLEIDKKTKTKIIHDLANAWNFNLVVL